MLVGQDEQARERGLEIDLDLDEDNFRREPVRPHQVHFPHQHPTDVEVSSSSEDNMIDPHDLNAPRL